MYLLKSQHKLLLASIVFAMLGILACLPSIRQLIHNRGWIKPFESAIAIRKILPQKYGDVFIQNNSLFVSLMNGSYQRLDLNGNTLWQFDMQDYTIYPPAIDYGNLFITSFDGRLYALDINSGEEKWRFTIPQMLKADTEAQVGNEHVYFGGRDGIFYALNKNTGMLRWKFATRPIDYEHVFTNQSIIHFGRFSLDTDTVYIYSATDNAVYALNQSTGAVRWVQRNIGFTYNKPVVYTESVAVWNDKQEYILLDKKTGNILRKIKSQNNLLVTHNDDIYSLQNNEDIELINASSGQTKWRITNEQFLLPHMFIASNDSLVILKRINNTHMVTAFRQADGKALWTTPVNIQDVVDVTETANRVYVIGTNTQYAIDAKTGKIIWITSIQNISREALTTLEGLYLISENTSDLIVYYIHATSGVKQWQFAWNNVHPAYIKEKNGDLYFMTKDQRSIVRLNHDSQADNVKASQLAIYDPNKRRSWDKITLWIKNTIYINHAKFIVNAYQNLIEKNDIYELVITSNNTFNKRNQQNVKILTDFIDPYGKTHRVHGFYFDKNMWKIRFAPSIIGNWQWTSFIDKPTRDQIGQGTFLVQESNREGFLSIPSKYGQSFSVDDQREFYPVGLQDCIIDKNHDGNPIDQWFPGVEYRPTINPTVLNAYSLNDYLSLYQKSGFNLWRFGVNNCSYSLWKELRPYGNRYALNEGLRTDDFFSALKNQGYHIWMSVLSFSLPYENSLTLKHKRAILKDYLSYIVARYAAFVDVWELANEIHLDDETITIMSSYLRSIDPYKHPITTNWEQPNNVNIEINSLHWYDSSCNDNCDKNLESQILDFTPIDKPTVFSEQGNRDANWDETSADRFRVRLWMGYMKNISYIFWNSSSSQFSNSFGSSNIFLGPAERKYVSIFNKLIHDNNFPQTITQITSDTDGVKIFGRGTDHSSLFYLYRQIRDQKNKSAMFQVDIPYFGTASWINAQTGNVLSQQLVVAGKQYLTTPPFKTDIILSTKSYE